MNNNNNKNKTTLKTLLMMSITILLMTSPIVNLQDAQAETGDLLLTINNPTPATSDQFGDSVATLPNGNIVVGARYDDTGATDSGSVYLFDDISGNLLLTINNPAPATSDHFGESVATTPNGDIVVGAYADDAGATDSGSVYLFDGTNGDLLLTIGDCKPITTNNNS